MAYKPAKCDALMMPSGPNDHMFVILTDAFIRNGYESHLLANFCSVKQGIYHDPTCVVPAGQHPFLKYNSFVAYQFADIHFASDLAAGMTSGKFALLQPVSTPLLDQIRNGIPLSPHTPKKCKTYYDKNK
jgi:hypothetical protein